jgi:hypothetical protein
MTLLNKHTKYHHTYTKTKKGHVTRYFVRAKKRAADKNIPFDLDLVYLNLIATDVCPVFGTEFVWGRQQGPRHRYTPSLDRVIPELGYVKGNVVFISMWANMIKADATEKELYAVADWLHDKRKEVLENVKSKPTTPVSATNHLGNETHPQLGTVSSAGTREDSYDLDHYQRTVRGEDSDYWAQTRGGDGVGYGMQEVGASSPVTRIENHGDAEPEIVRLEFGSRHLPD